MESQNLIDLSACGGNLALLDEEATKYIKIMMPLGTSPEAFELERVGIDLYAIPTLLRLWAGVIEARLTQGGQVEEWADGNA